jgi:hypothetical protein
MFENLFSKIFGFHTKRDITIWDDAPEEFRMGLLSLIRKCGIKRLKIKEMINEIFRKRIDPHDLSDDTKLWERFETLIFQCDWYKVYDVCEVAYKNIYFDIRSNYSVELNNLFEEYGIGWKFEAGKVVARIQHEMEAHFMKTTTTLNLSNLSMIELQEAKRNLSKRPIPDLEAASYHCKRALEAISRSITGNDSDDLATLMKNHAGELGIPKPLDMALENMWEFLLEDADQLTKRRKITRQEVELFLGIASVVITYLFEREKMKKIDKRKEV